MYRKSALIIFSFFAFILLGARVSHAFKIPYGEKENSALVVHTGSQVYLPSGTYYFTEKDFSVSAKSIPMVWERTYRSNRVFMKNGNWVFGQPEDGPLGYGWYSPFTVKFDIANATFINDEGRCFNFQTDSNGAYMPNEDAGLIATKTATGYQVTEIGGNSYIFNSSGILNSISDPRGNAATINYDSNGNLMSIADVVGRPIFTFTTDSNGRILTVTDLAKRVVSYQYDSSGNLINVTHALNAVANTVATYTYNTYHGLTTKANALGETYTIAYFPTWVDKGVVQTVTDPVGTSLIKAGQSPSGHQVSFNYDFPNRIFYYTDWSGVQYKIITNESGQELEQDINGVAVSKSQYLPNRQIETTDAMNNTTQVQKNEWGNVTQETDARGNIWKYTYDLATQKVTSETDPMGTVTNYAYDAYGNLIKEAVAAGTPEETVTTYAYDQNNELLSETKAGATTYYTYDSAGNMISITDPDGNTTTMTYDQVGNLIKKTLPMIGDTQYHDYDFNRKAGMIVDPNGNATVNAYDALGRIVSVTNPDGGVIQYSYTTAGGSCPSCGSSSDKIAQITQPDGNSISYQYNNHGQISQMIDNSGDSINYTYDTLGRKIKDDIEDASGNIQQYETYEYDALNRITKEINPDSSYTAYVYDSNGNKTSVQDPNGNLTTYTYDALNRLASATQGSAVTKYSYDRRSALTGVTDANGNTTNYTYNLQGEIINTVSPDTGTTTYTYDANGNKLTNTDAKGITAKYNYDALGRLLSVFFPNPADNISYTYDKCSNGKGHLCTMADPSGVTSYAYDVMGRVTQETSIINGVTHTLKYGYDLNGNLTSITYPSGRVITYNYANNQVIDVLNNGIDIASNIKYVPFGGLAQLTYGNGIKRSVVYDQQYRITSIVSGTVQNLSYSYDKNGNIVSITNNLDPTKNKTFAYDPMGQIVNATGPWGNLSWTYDSVGNRLSQISSVSGLTNYSYQPGTDKLTGTSGANISSFAFDNNGNTITENSRQYIYNQNQRLISAVENGITIGAYNYNGNGQRVKKTADGQTTIFTYDNHDNLIEESDLAGIIKTEYVFLNDAPLALIQNGTTYYYHNDHLDSPQAMTDPSEAVVWKGEFMPFGEPMEIEGAVINNLRFPGQYSDSETGLNQNWHRDYEPEIGRYIESDPIGIEGAILSNYVYGVLTGKWTVEAPIGFSGSDMNLFGYDSQNPINETDPLGLFSRWDCINANLEWIKQSIETTVACGEVAEGDAEAAAKCCEDGLKTALDLCKATFICAVGNHMPSATELDAELGCIALAYDDLHYCVKSIKHQCVRFQPGPHQFGHGGRFGGGGAGTGRKGLGW